MKTRHGTFRRVLFFAALALVLAGCDRPAKSGMSNPLRVGLRPDRTQEQIEADYGPLLRHLEASLGVRIDLMRSTTPEEFGARFERGDFDLAFLDGLEFAAAEQRVGAVPLVMRAEDRRFSSVVIARHDLAGEFPEALRGRSFVFAPPRSFSGAVMPREFFRASGLEPERFFGSVRHLATHGVVLDAVMRGEADAGVVNGPWLRRRIAEGAVDPRRFRQLLETPPFANFVWAAPARLVPPLRSRVAAAFLALDADDPAQRDILRALRTRAFMPATRSDFDQVREVFARNHERPAR